MDVFILDGNSPTEKADETDKSSLIRQRQGKPRRWKMILGAAIGVGLVVAGVVILVTLQGSSKHQDVSPYTYGVNQGANRGQLVKPAFRPSTVYNTPSQYSYNYNEGRFFALSFPRIHLEQNESTYSILIIAREPTFVNVTVPDLHIDKTVFVGPGESHEEVLDVAITTRGGVEYKAVYISSAQNVTVECSTMQFSVRDAFLALPVNGADTEYYISTCSGSGCEFMAVSFVSVVATENNTTLDITCPPGVTGCTTDINLHRNQTYTLYTQHDTELTGLHVKSSKPVSVFSGNPCFGLADGTDQSDNQVVVASMPPVRQLGTLYLTPLISSDPSKRHRLRIVASSSNTTLLIPSHGINTVLDVSQFYNLDYYDALNKSVAIQCSKPCLVVHCNKQHTGYTRQVFMMPLIPEEAYASNVFFSTIDSTAEGNFMYHYLSIIANQGDPVESLYLDDVSLEAEDWTNTEAANTSAIMISISPGLHELKSISPSVRFAAYIHGNGAPTTDFPGYGLETGRGDPQAPPPSAPPTEGPDTRVQPVYQINLYGNFTSRSGEDFDMQCTLDYSDELGEKAASMIPVVNSLLGASLCDQRHPDDLRVVSVTHYLSTNGPKGITRVDYFIELDRDLQISEVHQCADEVKVYLMDHVNWGLPLLPALPGCPFPEFDPPTFYDDGSHWICVTSLSDHYPPTPGYQVELRSEFITLTGEDLSEQCGIDYKQELDQRVAEMFVELNNNLLGKVVCEDLEVTALTGTGALVHVGAEGVVDVRYVLQSADTHAFDEIYDCADDVILYLIDHENWGIPLLPQVPGCPRLWFYQLRFQEKGQSWVCFS